MELEAPPTVHHRRLHHLCFYEGGGQFGFVWFCGLNLFGFAYVICLDFWGFVRLDWFGFFILRVWIRLFGCVYRETTHVIACLEAVRLRAR